jgi:chromate reductase, NAD(P)H dehydrogenase (quinone)
MSNPIHFVGLSGSLRKASLNMALLRAAAALAPEGVTIEVLDLHDLPMYDGDLEAAGYPPPVLRLREAILGADGILISSPEYNHSISPVLTNAIAWASRPPANCFAKKPVALMGASMSPVGTARAQAHTKPVLVTLETVLLAKPEVLVSFADKKIDPATATITDDTTRGFVQKAIAAFADLVRRTGND